MYFLRNATDGKRKKKQVIPGAIIAITIFRSGVGPIDKDKSSIAPSHVTPRVYVARTPRKEKQTKWRQK